MRKAGKEENETGQPGFFLAKEPLCHGGRQTVMAGRGQEIKSESYLYVCSRKGLK
jgi:hypothetical protein